MNRQRALRQVMRVRELRRNIAAGQLAKEELELQRAESNLAKSHADYAMRMAKAASDLLGPSALLRLTEIEAERAFCEQAIERAQHQVAANRTTCQSLRGTLQCRERELRQTETLLRQATEAQQRREAKHEQSANDDLAALSARKVDR